MFELEKLCIDGGFCCKFTLIYNYIFQNTNNAFDTLICKDQHVYIHLLINCYFLRRDRFRLHVKKLKDYYIVLK